MDHLDECYPGKRRRVISSIMCGTGEATSISDSSHISSHKTSIHRYDSHWSCSHRPSCNCPKSHLLSNYNKGHPIHRRRICMVVMEIWIETMDLTTDEAIPPSE